MSEVFTVKGKLSLDAGDFHEGVDEAVQEGKKLADTIDQQSKGIKGSLGSALSVMGGNLMSNALSTALGFLFDLGKEAIQTASDIQEVQNVVDVTFGDSAAAIESWANTARSQFGLTELQAKQYTSTMGAMLKSMGIGESDVYGMSTAMAGLAADMASFYNLDFDEAFNKIRSGISGETEPLKQLGINMSVANLEAYALSQGITTAYESMSQAEQATLRYNYLMQVTADAQGDFARTSDGLANSWRTFKTSMSSIVASIGEVVLPAVNEAINVIGDMIDSFGSLPKTMAKIDKSYAENTASIFTNHMHANTLIDTLDELSQKEELTAVETAQWNEAVSQLTAIYPSLQGMIGSTTGELNASIDAIKAETDALKESALEKAKIAAMQAKVDAWADNAVKAGAAKVELDKSQAELKQITGSRKAIEAEMRRIEELGTKMAAEYGMTFADLAWSAPTDELADMSNAYSELGTALSELTNEEEKATKKTEKLGEKYNELQGYADASEAEVKQMEETLSQMMGSADGAAGGMDDLTGAGNNAANGIFETTNAANDLKKKLEKLQDAGKQAKQLFDDIEKYKLDNLANISKSVEGLYGTFDKADKVRKTSFKSMMQGVESQIEQSNRWLAAWKELQNMGASESFLTNFDYSPEGIAQMEALIKAGPEAVAEMETQLGEAAALRNEVTGELFDNTLKADTDYQAMVAQAEAITSAVAQGMTELQASVDALELSIEAEDGATTVIDEIQKALDALNGQVATTYVQTIPLRGVNGSHATGLPRVPFDGYIAMLHEDEAVLNKREANEWRTGRNASGGQVVNVTQNIQAVPMTPSELAAQTKHALGMMRFSV